MRVYEYEEQQMEFIKDCFPLVECLWESFNQTSSHFQNEKWMGYRNMSVTVSLGLNQIVHRKSYLILVRCQIKWEAFVCPSFNPKQQKKTFREIK